MPSVADYFEHHLARLTGRPLLSGYAEYSMTFSIRFRDRGETWRLVVTDGCIREIAGPFPEESDEPVRFLVDEPVFFEIVTGSLSPQKAFFARRTDIRGSLFEGMKLAKLLSLFFTQYPYRPEVKA